MPLRPPHYIEDRSHAIGINRLYSFPGLRGHYREVNGVFKPSPGSSTRVPASGTKCRQIVSPLAGGSQSIYFAFVANVDLPLVARSERINPAATSADTDR
jgi:hypothetical protein